MKVFFALIIAVLFTCSVGPACRADDRDRFVAIAYHDVVKTRAELASDAITVDHLIEQFEWLLTNGYHPVSIDDLLAARSGKKPLPDKAVLLSWDDGYASFYELVFPLLKAYNFPAVLALEGTWLEPGSTSTVHYGQNAVSRKHFLSWQQLRELAASPLVELASHSYNLHHGVLADRYGDKLPAGVVRKYDKQSKTYETDDAYFTRVYNDLEKNSRLLQAHLGRRPRVMVWPYGLYNKTTLAAARKAGMEICMTLNAVPGNIHNLQEIGRMYPTLNTSLAEFRNYLTPDIRTPVRHFVKVDSGQLLDPSPDTEKHYGLFLNRLKALGPSMVLFSPVVEKKDGLQALFPSRVVPMLQDRLMRFSWHTFHRGGAATYFWLPSVLFRTDTFASKEKGRRFFSEMGNFAFGDGAVVDAPSLVSSLFALPTDKIDKQVLAYWDPARRKMARNHLRNNCNDVQCEEILARLAALQEGQPFLEMGLVLPLARLSELDTDRATVLLRYFDFLVVDTGVTASPDSLQSALGNLDLLDMGLTKKVYILVHYENNDRELAETFASFPYLNIINWGYDNDDFLAQRPAIKGIRPFVSDRRNPFQ